jgi:hypothetical protein
MGCDASRQAGATIRITYRRDATGKKKRRPSAPFENCGNWIVVLNSSARACAGTVEPGFPRLAPSGRKSVDQPERTAAGHEVEIVERQGEHLDGFVRLRNFSNGLEFNVFDVHGCFLFRKSIVVGVSSYKDGTTTVMKRTLKR